MFKKISFNPENRTASIPSTKSLETTSAPRPIDSECDYKIPSRLFCHWIPTSGPREIVRALTPDERSKVSARAQELRDGLQPYSLADVEHIEVELIAMLKGFRNLRNTDEINISVTMFLLREFPFWAIAKACGAIATGKAGLHHAFPPSDAEIYGAVASVVQDYRKALATAEALLEAPVELPPPPRPARVEYVPRPVNEQKREDWRDGRGEVELPPSDGKHMERVMADLAQRKARKAEQEQSHG